MNDDNSEPTIDRRDSEAALDAGLAIAFARKSEMSDAAGISVLKSLRDMVPGLGHLRLRDPLGETEPPVQRPGTLEMPLARNPAARYQFQGEIARGGMGAVLKGHDVDLGRDVAVKVLLDAHRDKPQLFHRFVEEVQISGQLQHPGIVPIYELGQLPDKRPYFAMKLVKGQTLTSLLVAKGAE